MAEIDYSLYYRRWHDSTPEAFDSQARGYARWLGGVIADLPREGQVLDYGCGYGFLSFYLKQTFADVLSVDASSQQIEVALSRGLNARVVSVDEYPAWAATNVGRFDAVFLFDVLEHIPVDFQIQFLTLLSSCLKVGAPMYVKVPNANSLLAARWRYNDWTHTSSFTEASLDFVCLNAGLEQPVYFPDDSSARPRWPWLIRPSLGQYYLRGFLRSLWKLYLHAELGEQASDITVGYNLFARTRRLK